MGNSPLTLCIHQVWEKQTVQVVLPDGQVLFLPRPLTVASLLESHPFHFVCKGSPSLLQQRLQSNTRLETGEIYYLVPVPQQVVTANSLQKPFAGTQPKKVAEKVAFKPQLFDKSPPTFTDYAQLNLKPQRCLINFFVFRQNVASIMPEEKLRTQDQFGSHTPSTKYQRFDSKNRGVRGRKQIISWRPQLESILETNETNLVQEYPQNCSFSVSMFSSYKTLSQPSFKALTPPVPNPISVFSSFQKVLPPAPNPVPDFSSFKSVSSPSPSPVSMFSSLKTMSNPTPNPLSMFNSLKTMSNPAPNPLSMFSSFKTLSAPNPAQQREERAALIHVPFQEARGRQMPKYIYSA